MSGWRRLPDGATRSIGACGFPRGAWEPDATIGPNNSLEPASRFCYRYACPVWQAARGRGKISWSPLKKGDRHLTTIVFRGVFICPFGASPSFSTGCWAGASCLESDHVEMAAPKGANSKAQGNALGNRTTLKPVALKGRDVLPREASVSPFQGYRRGVSAFPGRCPGNAFEFGPFGATRVPLRTGESISVAINCHPERSEGSGSIARRSFAALRMTVIDSPILR